ncbi:MAG: phosphoethanolamine transferase [Rhodoferax sp.]|nr:phosphoethanolamine transferase [Rhodoferax sp.]
MRVIATLWVDNQSGCKVVWDRVPNVSTSHSTDPNLCARGERSDAVMLQGLDGRIAALPEARRANGVVVVLHQMGSHGPAYCLRSPQAFKRYLPECRSNDLQSCSREELVNGDDKTIAHMAHFLASTIEWGKRQQPLDEPAKVYVADHGVSLGEKNLYLHGMPYLVAPDVQKHVPWITWLSESFPKRNKISLACLKDEADKAVSHDNYFHSVLRLLGVQSQVYSEAMDIDAPCPPGSAAAMDASKASQ